MPEGLRARLTVTFGGLTLLAVILFALIVAGTLEQLLSDRLALDLEAQARLVAGQVAGDLAAGNVGGVERALASVDDATTARALVVDAENRLIAASEVEDRGRALEPGARATLERALGGETVREIAPRRGSESEVLIAAVPVKADGRVVGAVRLAYQLRDLEATLNRLNLAIGAGAVATGLVAAALAAGFAGAVTTPVRALSRAAKALAAGDLAQHVDIHSRGEVRQLVDAFNEMAARLREFEAGRREFASDVSHELHALASAMQTAAEALERGADREPALRDRLVTGLVGHTRRLTRLADDLLELARLEGGRLTFDEEEASLGAVARQVAAEWAAEATRHRVDLRVQVAGEPLVRGDHERLVQACGNLVENALKYAADGGWVGIAARQGERIHHLEVSDNGPGIPSGELANIFRRSYRVEGRAGEGPGGMGLGLAIADRIVRAHGGTITVTSAAGQGSTFHIRLPALVPETRPEAEAATPEHVERSTLNVQRG